MAAAARSTVAIPGVNWLKGEFSWIGSRLPLLGDEGDEEGVVPLALGPGLCRVRSGLRGDPRPRPTVLGSLSLNVDSARLLLVDLLVVVGELLLEALVLLEVVLESAVWQGLDAPGDMTSLDSAVWKTVPFNKGRLFGDVLRTTVGSRGGRKMAFDILCMPRVKADLVFCPVDVGLACSEAVGWSEADMARSVRILGYRFLQVRTAVGQRFEGRNSLDSVPAKLVRERSPGFRRSRRAVADDQAERVLQPRRQVARLTWILDAMLVHVGVQSMKRPMKYCCLSMVSP